MCQHETFLLVGAFVNQHGCCTGMNLPLQHGLERFTLKKAALQTRMFLQSNMVAVGVALPVVLQGAQDALSICGSVCLSQNHGITEC